MLLVGCRQPQSLVDEEWRINKLADARLGRTRTMIIHSRSQGQLVQVEVPRKTTFVVSNTVDGERIVCGYSVFQPSADYTVGATAPEIFVIRGFDRVSIAADYLPERFSQLQDEVCGPQWVKPVLAPEPVP